MVRVAILTASDKGAAGERQDASGDLAERRLREGGHTVAARAIVADDREAIAAQLRAWADGTVAEVVITTGGTGLTERDVTPEATRDVAERDVPGLPVALAFEGLKKTPYAVLSRGIAVLRKRTLIVNLPGNPKAVDEGLDVLMPLLPHVGQLLAGPHEHRGDADTGHGGG
ncbi:MAG: MogA/MoaB family molybdenum cofactor biosynthesis protein [Chloroflexi bacterium]|nr:MogA/MoaB family molybdenum cofactor biosynthesis protein [Chloroflexota bacterium]